MLPDPPSWAAELFTVGVTGTNGKTSTTTFAAAALGALDKPVVRITSVGAYLDAERLEVGEDHAGFIEAMRIGRTRGATHAAIELTSEALAAGFARAWPCRVGVLTSFDRDHLDAHGSAEHYLASKAQLFVALPPGGAAVLNAAEAASELVREVVPDGVRVLRYGLLSRVQSEHELDLLATTATPSWNGTRIELAGPLAGGERVLDLRAIGEPFAENALGALLSAIACGVPVERAVSRIAGAPPPPGRFECVARHPFVVVDYAHTPSALARTLDTARRLCLGRVTAVFGAGGNRDREKRLLLGAAAQEADRVIVTNDNPRDHDPRALAGDVVAGLGAHPDVELELDRARAIDLAVERAGPNDVVVIAGRGHESFQVIGGVRHPLCDVEIAKSVHARRH